MVYKIVKARGLKPVIGELIGHTVEVVEEIQPGATGYVKYHGEYWKAKSDTLLKPGATARIVAKMDQYSSCHRA